jgi:hypothetical protein
MKKLIFLLVLFFVVISCSNQKKSPIEGVWQGVNTGDMQGWSGSVIKMWTNTYCAYLGEFKKDTMVYNVYGGGPYTLEGTHAVETILYNQNKQAIGMKAKMLYIIKGDTLIQMYPADDNWKVDSAKCNIEKYVRIK